MQLEHTFEVLAPPEQVWAYLLDVERVAPCMPGAELTEVVDETTWKGTVTVTLGPVKLTYKGKVVMQERDDEAHRVVLKATGQETGGKGTATATVTSTLETAGEGTRVLLVSDVTLSGAAAQYGRGMVGDVSARLTDQFADCLQEHLDTESTPAGDGERRPAAEPQPIRGFRLGLWTLWRAIVRFVRRLFGGGRSSR